MTEQAQIEDAVASYFRSLDTEDWVRMRTLWHPRGEMVAMGARARQGVDDVLQLLEKLFVPWPVHRDKPVRTLVSGDSATVEVEFTGVSVDGLEVKFDAVDVIDFDGGLIRRLTNWYDIEYARKVIASSAGRS
jgi:ketosteroid isomerase-like protein